MAHRLLRDAEADGWERSDFPITCKSCLDDNPCIRMAQSFSISFFSPPISLFRLFVPCSDLFSSGLSFSLCCWAYVIKCRICHRPFTVFRWGPGRDVRYKKTEIRLTYCKLKNVCQVRDTALLISSHDAITKSVINRDYFAEEHDQKFSIIMKLVTIPVQARAELDYESSYRKVWPNDTILRLRRTTLYTKETEYVGAECPYRHEMPVTGELSQQHIKDRYSGHVSCLALHLLVNAPVALKLLNKAGEMPSLEPHEDESIRTLDNFFAHIEIESIRMVLQQACAFVTYTTREGAEKAAEEPQAPKPQTEGSEVAWQQAAILPGGLLPRAVISQQQSQIQREPSIPPWTPEGWVQLFLPRKGLSVGPQGPARTGHLRSSSNRAALCLLRSGPASWAILFPFLPFLWLYDAPPPYQQYQLLNPSTVPPLHPPLATLQYQQDHVQSVSTPLSSAPVPPPALPSSLGSTPRGSVPPVSS
ncbi:hypothetical protein ACJRO7_023824 [Eucalyptus globulus]|uniref:Uncharacterized protein n=1 Tax=Eucalyptus globulus TaxID=34317 RepID=A0ABD3K839_EUCGL